MSTERLKVLEMLNAGTITIEQANQLIEALGERDVVEPVIANGQTIRIEHDEPVIAGEEPKAQDFGGFTFEQVIKMGAVGVRPEFIREVRELGLDVSFDQMIQMGAVGVRPKFIREVRAMGLDLSVEQMIQMGAVGVRPEFVAQLRKASAATA